MNTSLAITVSPPYRCRGLKRRNPHRHVYDDDQFQIKSIFKYNRIKKFIIFPEFDNKGRLHYHGTLELNRCEYVRFNRHAIFKLQEIGFVDVKKLITFTDKLKWNMYCRKDWHISQEILEITRPIWNNNICLDKKTKNEEYIEIELPKNIMDYFELV